MIEADYFIGPIRIHMYSWILLAGVLAGFFVARKLANRQGIEIRHIENLIFLNIIAGFFGARVFHVFTSLDYYKNAPIEIFYIWQGGLGIFGGLAAGVIVTFLYARRNTISFLKIADLLTPGLALAQSIGRWGNFFNQEAYGYPTDLPWKIFIASDHRFPGFETVEYYHPTFLYESLILLALFIVLFRFRTTSRSGWILATYLILYGISRYWIEDIRLDTNFLHTASANQVISVLLVVAGTLLMVFASSLRKQPIFDTIDKA